MTSPEPYWMKNSTPSATSIPKSSRALIAPFVLSPLFGMLASPQTKAESPELRPHTSTPLAPKL